LTLKDLTPGECQRQKIVIRQLVDEFVVTKEWVRRGGHKIHRKQTRYVVPQSSTRTRAMLIDADECCEDQAERHVGMEPFTVSFPHGERVLYGSRGEQGSISLEGVEGEYTLGDSVPLVAFAADEQWLAVPDGEALTFGLLGSAADESWDAADDDAPSEAEELAVQRVLFDMPLADVRALLGDSEEAVTSIARIRERAGGARRFEDVLAAGIDEQTLESLATHVLTLESPEAVADRAASDDEDVFIYAATYGTRSAAIEDYERLLASRAGALSEVFDLAVISTDDAGAVQIVRDNPPQEVASMRGLVMGAAAEILFPGSTALAAALTGGGRASLIAQRLRVGISGGDAAELGAVLGAGDAALIAIGGASVESQLDSALERATRSLQKTTRTDRQELKRELNQARQQSS
jgi:hypothetical protein